MPALGHASCRRVFWSERLRHASSKRKGAFAPAVIASASARRPASFALRLLTRVTRPVTLLQQPRRLYRSVPRRATLLAANGVGAPRACGRGRQPGATCSGLTWGPISVGSPAPMRCRSACQSWLAPVPSIAARGRVTVWHDQRYCIASNGPGLPYSPRSGRRPHAADIARCPNTRRGAKHPRARATSARASALQVATGASG